MADGLDAVRAILPGARLSEVATLRGSERSAVTRVRARWPDRERTVVVKRFEAADGWARECAGLASVADDAIAPVLLGASADPPVAVLDDLGTGPSVADALLGDDPDTATGAVLEWAAAVGRLHAATLGGRDRFRAELAMRSGNMPVVDAPLARWVDDVAGALEDMCIDLGVGVPAGSIGALRELPRRLGADSPHAALSPADACPDNNVRHAVRGEDRLTLIDFEGAGWRHVAWDVAYLAVPWPTCWCAWRVPRETTERAVERYRSAVEGALPYVRSEDFRADVGAAALGWQLMSSALFLPKALADDPPPRDPSLRAPSRRAMILHRLDDARRGGHSEPLAELAATLRADLVRRWGEIPLSYAPAYRDDD